MESPQFSGKEAHDSQVQGWTELHNVKRTDVIENLLVIAAPTV